MSTEKRPCSQTGCTSTRANYEHNGKAWCRKHFPPRLDAMRQLEEEWVLRSVRK